jgi:hypothetical protein
VNKQAIIKPDIKNKELIRTLYYKSSLPRHVIKGGK